VAPQAVAKSVVGTRRVAPPPPAPQIQPRAHVGGKVLSQGAAEENAAAKRALCAAYGGKVPKAPADFCK
jgi:hypothetical protein